MYYRYLNTFHVEPKNWEDFFEFLSYTKTEAKVLLYNKALSEDK